MDPKAVAGPFDLLYGRMLLYGIRDWPAYIARAWDLLAPGGWFEAQEADINVLLDGDDKPMQLESTWHAEQSACFQKLGVDLACPKKIPAYLEAQGFVDISVKKYRWMYGPWEGHPEGLLAAKVMTTYNPKANFQAFKRVLGHTKTAGELEVIRGQMLRDFGWSEDGKHIDFVVICGRKPDS